MKKRALTFKIKSSSVGIIEYQFQCYIFAFNRAYCILVSKMTPNQLCYKRGVAKFVLVLTVTVEINILRVAKATLKRKQNKTSFPLPKVSSDCLRFVCPNFRLIANAFN